MDYRYIIAIATGGIFVIALLIYVVSTVRARKIESAMRVRQKRIYCDPDLVKMDYDLAYYEDGAEANIKPVGDKNVEDALQGVSFTRLEVEEEEVTGNYKP